MSSQRYEASSRLQSEHEQIKVIAEQILKYTETKYWIRTYESYVIIIHSCTFSGLRDTQVEVFFGKGKHRLFI